jgi:hypothetical protein
MESSCEYGYEPSGSIKCWETMASRVVLRSIELVHILCFPEMQLFRKTINMYNSNSAFVQNILNVIYVTSLTSAALSRTNRLKTIFLRS